MVVQRCEIITLCVTLLPVHCIDSELACLGIWQVLRKCAVMTVAISTSVLVVHNGGVVVVSAINARVMTSAELQQLDAHSLVYQPPCVPVNSPDCMQL